MLRLSEMLAYVPVDSVRPAGIAQPSLALLDRLLVDAFVASLFVALLTVSALHFLRPLIRKTAQALSLWRLARLPDGLRECGSECFSEDSESSKFVDYGDVKAVAGLAGMAPDWLKEAAGAWSLEDRMAWAKRGEGEQKPGRAGLGTRSTLLPDELFMRTIENEVKAVVARPSQHPYLFTLVTAGAPNDARAVVARFDALAKDDPAKAALLTRADGEKSETNVAAGIIAAQNAVAAAAESWLDRFQLSLASQSLIVSRIFAIAAGIGFAAIAAQFITWHGSAGLLPAVGLSGGLLGLLANDSVTAWAARRR
ncbi:MAG: hypothetical protein ACJ8ER_12405 [Allosphingosinicella sp.]